MRSAAEICKISLCVESYFPIGKIAQQIQLVFISFICKIFPGVNF